MIRHLYLGKLSRAIDAVATQGRIIKPGLRAMVSNVADRFVLAVPRRST